MSLTFTIIKRTYHFLLISVLLFTAISSAPTKPKELENSLERFLNVYYEKYVKPQRTLEETPLIYDDDINAKVDDNPRKMKIQNEELSEKIPEDGPAVDIYETMQGDQPAVGNIAQNHYVESADEKRNISSFDYISAMKQRARENWIQVLKQNILRQLGREENTTVPRTEETKLTSFNISQIIPALLNSSSMLNDDQITEKMRSFYPSCDIPGNTDQELWKDDDIMNLFFNFDYTPDNKNSNIATATLRLYRLPTPNGTKFGSKKDDCDTVTYNMDFLEEDKLLRVSIYWYTKPLKKRRGSVKRRLCDSKMVSDTSRWVELSVKPATKAWTKGRNLGLGVVVEDQDGNMLRADRYFKGASCMVGVSTPKPIPTIVIDAIEKTNEFNGIDSLRGRNSTSTIYSGVQLLPTIDICTLEFPENYTQPSHITHLRINACNLRKIHEQSQKIAEKERIERLATLPDFKIPSARHIRHQRQHLANKMSEQKAVEDEFDPRSRILDSKVIWTNEELQNLTLNKGINR